MEHPIERLKHAGCRIKIYPDSDPECPRAWDNAGKLFIMEGRSYIGVNETGLDLRSYDTTDDFMQAVKAEYPGALTLPVFKYEHSCVAYSTRSFIGRAQHADWDSGCVGFILMSRETMLAEWGKKLVTSRVRDMARKCMESEVEAYSQWANGEVYGYVVSRHGAEVDSCWGFFGLEYCMEQAKEVAEHNAVKRKAA